MTYDDFDDFCDGCCDKGAMTFLEEITEGPEKFWRDRVYATSKAKDVLFGMWSNSSLNGTVYSKPMKGFSVSRRKFKEI